MELLTGGGINEVYRTGDTVRRPTGAWSPLVHGLLRHVRAKGFTGAPDFHGIDEEGREVLTFFPGDVSNYPLSPAARSEEALVSAARLLRSYHDATVGFGRSGDWMLPAREPAEVVCHGDFAPYNCVLDGDTAVAMIDFDTAHPAPRRWDVAYALYRWAPLTHPDNGDGFGTVEQQAARAARFCDAYGLEDRSNLAEAVADRLTALVEFMHAQADAGNAAFASHIADGHDRLYLRDIEYIRTSFTGLLG
ncbi:aminoglycoside phosphotransferase [Lentzea guizhouensis]|uniref:Aminoglycoside phosphotransferase n=1 Tax=Lentzea guizhouensis TaxID=1586287 RepID=A0A1B2HMW9_9PSEU|nr:aminoglycoside phosphotransferase family protein [Lentzea guizhouensis]ANZ39077.1 aminoglycoside phosphotransferase [Lentzea guizhouensis]